MGKHETGYARVDKDLYPTRERWVVEALAEHVDLIGAVIWECAAGTGEMLESLKATGAASVLCTDIVDRGYPVKVFDFLSSGNPMLPRWDLTITNPPFGYRGRTAIEFIKAGLRRLSHGQTLALLLPADFDSAKRRLPYFRDCPQFVGKIVLTRRPVWFERTDGQRPAPKENSAWFVWERAALRARQPIVLYAPTTAPSGTLI
jgi:hypothetical protein